MKILLTNDDGIDSPVLTLLANALISDHEIVISAPATDQSGMSQAFTHGVNRFLGYHQDVLSPFPKYQVSGTPCDCVKFAVAELQRGSAAPFDLIISGINLGENAGMSAVYSGTVAAAREGAMWGIPALAVSVWENHPDHLQSAVHWLKNLLQQNAKLPIQAGYLWNINFPACTPNEVRGVQFTTMSTVMFKDSYEAVTTNHGLKQFRLVGYKPKELFRVGTDDFALAQNYIAITPLQVDQSQAGEAARLTASGFKTHFPNSQEPR